MDRSHTPHQYAQVANIVEDYVKKTDPEPTPQQVCCREMWAETLRVQ